MARSQEKAHNLMNKWITAKHRMRLGQTAHRPLSAYECKTASECLYWRQDVVKELEKKLSQIQNPNLPENTIRDLNDEVNRLVRSRGHWEHRIRELGGVILDAADQNTGDDDPGSALFIGGSNTYKYYGAAKNLPEVKLLLKKEPEDIPKKGRYELYDSITPAYYGFGDEEDGRLLLEEAEAEAEAIEKEVSEWKKIQALKMENGG
ncbi:hypothetical protein AV274_2908 [Blastocystis sp. ATCC 50177/Nand II]|uniref:Pre-mRNA-splicing factor ISY1 n=1 Tax=Blastocystis sp. subtype 1 (strain ATCC 50177 / NandII) TaxID=478820 RepID=A0A196SD70_BLAHN|nr:hypothetical protein AV274_4354 [Blastocystis sp. ATCC 50177/Nand II]OAO15379.1 hypothetical protein AV274_2908 [Blastocystis sp. ATCC 50177/Nand II]